MRTHITIAATVLLITAMFTVAGPAVATDNDDSYEHGNDAEHYPHCHGANGERQSVGTTIDPTQVDRALGTEIFSPEDKVEVEVDREINGEHALTFCSGENWDGQDPNTKESDQNEEAFGDADEPLVDPAEGTVYVNPLLWPDCSGWNSDHHEDGCSGGTDKPAFSELIHLRATADVPGTEDRNPEATVYVNEEIWGVGRASPAVRVDAHNDGDTTDEGGYVSLYLEDHSDQLNDAILGDPLGLILEDSFDGNYLLIPFDPLQGGQGGEGDCTSHEYQYTSSGETHDPAGGPAHEHDCRRDNSAIATIQFGYSWLPAPDASPAMENAPTLP